MFINILLFLIFVSSFSLGIFNSLKAYVIDALKTKTKELLYEFLFYVAGAIFFISFSIGILYYYSISKTGSHGSVVKVKRSGRKHPAKKHVGKRSKKH